MSGGNPAARLFDLLLVVGGLSCALSCYSCFTKTAERFCTDYVGQTTAELKVANCWFPIKELINQRQVYQVRVAESEYKRLKAIYKKALEFIKKRRKEFPRESYPNLLNAVEKEVLQAVFKLKKATPCNYTCGINKAAYYFDCRFCKMKGCEGVSFECPIEDVKVKETGQVSMKCQSTFTIPKIDTVTWMFASNVRSDVITQFKVLHVGNDDTLTIQNVKMKNTGTYACDVFRKDTLLLQRFFYLIVMRSTLQSSIELQAMFHNVLLEKRSTLKTPTAKPVPPPAQASRQADRNPVHSGRRHGNTLCRVSYRAIYRWVTRSK